MFGLPPFLPLHLVTPPSTSGGAWGCTVLGGSGVMCCGSAVVQPLSSCEGSAVSGKDHALVHVRGGREPMPD